MQFDSITELFNNREIAVAVWLIIGLALAVINSNIRGSLKSLIVQFFHFKILVLYLLAVAYTFLGVYLFSKCNVWTTAQLKDTILWCIFTIPSTMLKLNRSREDKNYFKNAAKENFKLSVIIEFITGVYTFSLSVELILIPLAILIGVMQAVAGKQEKYVAVQKALSKILVLFGLFIVGYTIYEITIHVHQFASYETLRDFLLSPMLVLWFLPFIYLMSLYITYEIYFITMQSRIMDKRLLAFAKWQALFRFNIDTRGFERWKNRLFIGSINTKDDIRASIKEIKRLQKVEGNPPEISYEFGWSPYAAKDFLKDKGIDTRYYTNVYENEWSASSDYTKLEDSFMSNTICYYIQGTETVTKNLHLVLNMNNLMLEDSAIKTFSEYAMVLYLAATNTQLPKNVGQAILKKKHVELYIGKVKLITRKDDWINQNNYSLLFYIQHI